MEPKPSEQPLPREKDSLLSLVSSVGKKIEAESTSKPWWLGQLKEFSSTLEKLYQNRDVSMTDYQVTGQQLELPYPLDVNEAIRGDWSGRMNSLAWTQTCLVMFGSSKLPISPDQAIDQLKIDSWWIGGKDGTNEQTTNETLAIYDLATKLFPELAKEKFASDPKMKDANIGRLQKFGDELSGKDLESVTIQMQNVYWDKLQEKKIFIPQFSVRVSRKLSGECMLTISGEDRRRPRDTRNFHLKNPDLGDRIIKKIEHSLDTLTEKQASRK